jgi:hypothetical protein
VPVATIASPFPCLKSVICSLPLHESQVTFA